MLSRFQIENLYDQNESYITYGALDRQTNKACIIRRYVADEKSAFAKIKNWEEEFNTIVNHYTRLEIPSLTNIIAGGYDPVDKYPFIVFEWFPHQSMQELVDQNLKVDSAQDHLLTSNMLRALEHIHDRNLVHGDLTPVDLLYTDDESKDTWVLNWDPIVSLVATNGKRKYSKGIFTANELLMKMKASPSSDLYALGKTLQLICTPGPTMERWLEVMASGANTRFRDVDDARSALLGQTALPSKKTAPITRILSTLKKNT